MNACEVFICVHMQKLLHYKHTYVFLVVEGKREREREVGNRCILFLSVRFMYVCVYVKLREET